jgi:hypothetical protein
MTNKSKKLITNLGKFLESKIKKGKFPLENNYGEIFFLGGINNKKIKKEILETYLKKNKNYLDFHWEFNNYILQKEKVNEEQFQIYHFNQPFIKKVTNWIFLRGLIYLRSTDYWKKLKGNFMIVITLLINQKNGFLTDNRLYRKKEYSNQYHAFATALLGEIFLETNKKFYKKRFYDALIKLKKICKNAKTFNNGGRGSKQIFGYAAAIYGLTLGQKILRIGSKKEIDIMINELKKFQRKDGSLPLCLTKKEFHLIEKNYFKRKNKIDGWESYNRYYDYLGFAYYFLDKSLKNFF